MPKTGGPFTPIYVFCCTITRGVFCRSSTYVNDSTVVKVVCACAYWWVVFPTNNLLLRFTSIIYVPSVTYFLKNECNFVYSEARTVPGNPKRTVGLFQHLSIRWGLQGSIEVLPKSLWSFSMYKTWGLMDVEWKICYMYSIYIYTQKYRLSDNYVELCRIKISDN